MSRWVEWSVRQICGSPEMQSQHNRVVEPAIWGSADTPCTPKPHALWSILPHSVAICANILKHILLYINVSIHFCNTVHLNTQWSKFADTLFIKMIEAYGHWLWKCRPCGNNKCLKYYEFITANNVLTINSWSSIHHYHYLTSTVRYLECVIWVHSRQSLIPNTQRGIGTAVKQLICWGEWMNEQQLPVMPLK